VILKNGWIPFLLGSGYSLEDSSLGVPALEPGELRIYHIQYEETIEWKGVINK